MSASEPAANIKTLSLHDWETFLNSLYERDDRLERREHGQTYLPEEQVDAYVFSGHAEAMQSAEVDGDLWGTLEDLEETATTDEEAWQKIMNFYQGRGCLLVQVTGAPEREEWLLSEELAARLGLI